MSKDPSQKMDNCGEASALSKLSTLALQDRALKSRQRRIVDGERAKHEGDEKAEYFEFSQNWSTEFKNSQLISPLAAGNAENFEVVFDGHREAVSKKHEGWIKDFQAISSSNQLTPSLPADLERFNQIFGGNQVSWTKEFEKYEEKESHSVSADSWVEDFQKEPEDEVETAKSARQLLDSLNLSEPKLAASKFVAYLRELSESDSTINGTYESSKPGEFDWKSQFISSMREAGLANDETDDQWSKLEKSWDQYEFSGNGYENFAFKEFAAYRYSLDDAQNPFHGLSASTIKSRLGAFKGQDVGKYILALEELTRLQPQEAKHWLDLATAQTENEIDVQAIAAFMHAVKLDPSLNEAWLGLAASCVNEYCLPDAFEAFSTILRNLGIPAELRHDPASLLCDIFRNSSIFPDEGLRRRALAVLLNVTGQHDAAINLLQDMVKVHPEDYSIWNRLGATLANARRYEEAIDAYTQSLAINATYVRAQFNTGISFMNLGNYPNAMRFMTRALQHHLPAKTSAPTSEALITGYDSIWNTMRIISDMWNRDDLSVMIEERNIPAIMSVIQETL